MISAKEREQPRWRAYQKYLSEQGLVTRIDYEWIKLQCSEAQVGRWLMRLYVDGRWEPLLEGNAPDV